MMRKGWEKPVCDICQSREFLVSWMEGITTWEHKGKFNFVKCENCGLVFQSPRIPFEKVVKFYPSESYWGRDVTKKRKTKELNKEREWAYGFVYKEVFSRINKGAILDIGSGLGLFLSKFKDKGWEVLGTDISSDVAGFSQKVFGVKVLLGDVVDMDLPKKHFDIVSMNSVLEHVYSPRKTLKKAAEVLKENGLLVLVLPNVKGFGQYIFKRGWIQLQPGRHLYLFSPETLKNLLKDTGFEVDKISHAYWAQNYYSLFQSFRFNFSPKFKKKEQGGLASGSLKEAKKPSPFSIKKEFWKLLAKILAVIIAAIEPIVGRGEIMTVYAKKSQKRKY